MTTMWTPAPQRDVLRQQEYRRWVLTSEPRKRTPTRAPTFVPLDWDRATREAWELACEARDTWVPSLDLLVTACPSTTC